MVIYTINDDVFNEGVKIIMLLYWHCLNLLFHSRVSGSHQNQRVPVEDLYVALESHTSSFVSWKEEKSLDPEK